MGPSVVVLVVFTGAVWASAATPPHDFRYVYGCYESGGVRVDIVVDGEVAVYADFSKEEVVILMPHIPQALKDLKEKGYEVAKSSVAHCRSVWGKARRAFRPEPPLRQDAPDISIYSLHQDAAANTLFCSASHFYPPSINFTWTKNGVEVTEGVSDRRYLHDSDGTFRRMSTLSCSPREGDVYSCSVEHEASRRPLAKTWKLYTGPAASVSPAAWFFGASLLLCLIGVGTGAFFFTKKPNVYHEQLSQNSAEQSHTS